jgi:hypothetical protein
MIRHFCFAFLKRKHVFESYSVFFFVVYVVVLLGSKLYVVVLLGSKLYVVVLLGSKLYRVRSR